MRAPEELPVWLSERGGSAHAADARAVGFTTHGIRITLEQGGVVRVRKNWLVRSDAPPSVRLAADAGGRLTCISEAARRGLWIPHDAGAAVHVAVAPTASRNATEGVRLHWATGPAPVARTASRDPLLNVLFQVARCLPLGDALAVWESAIRRRDVSVESLKAVRWQSEAARRLADRAGDLSDSGLETRFVLLVGQLGLDVRQQVAIDGHRVDVLIGRHLVVQLDGFAFHTSSARQADLRQDARLVLRGYTVLRFDYAQVFFDPEYVLAVIAAAVAQGRDR